jgi:putative phage-type endonuclease
MALTAEQLAERQEGLGGSDALAYCGRDPRKTPLALWLEKRSEPNSTAVATNSRMDWGDRLEPVIRDWLASELGKPIEKPTRMFRADSAPYLIGHVDGLVASPAPDWGFHEGAEIKACDKFEASEFGEVGTDQVPVRFVLQCTHYMIVTNIKRWHLAVLVGGNDARHYVIDYDPDLAAMLMERAKLFWSFVETNTPPDPMTLEDAAIRWPKALDQAIVADNVIRLALKELVALREDEDDKRRRADSLEVMVKSFMGGADAITEAGSKLTLATWRNQSRTRLDVTRLTTDMPEVAARYRTTSNFRVFRLR